MARIAPWLVALAIVGGGAYYVYWWNVGRYATPEPAPAAPVASAPAPAAPPAIEHPIEQAKPDGPAADAAPSGLDDPVIGRLVSDLAGSDAARRFLRLDDFVRRIVVTVDALPRERAAVRLWPVATTPGRFEPEIRGNEHFLAAQNARRYEPFVRFVESVDTGKAVALYVKLYPLFQQAYRELGYSDRYFNDRLVAVIDHLLAAPELKEPPALEQKKVFWEYVDADLEARSVGHRTLMRMGPANTARLKAKLREVRRQVTGQPTG